MKIMITEADVQKMTKSVLNKIRLMESRDPYDDYIVNYGNPYTNTRDMGAISKVFELVEAPYAEGGDDLVGYLASQYHVRLPEDEDVLEDVLPDFAKMYDTPYNIKFSYADGDMEIINDDGLFDDIDNLEDEQLGNIIKEFFRERYCNLSADDIDNEDY